MTLLTRPALRSIALTLFLVWRASTAAAVSEQIDYGAIGNYVRNSDLTLAASGDLVRIGVFTPAFDFAANANNFQATNAAFTEFDRTTVGGAQGSGPGRFFHSFLLTTGGFENRQLYLWIFNADPSGTASAWVIVTNSGWFVPPDGDFSTLDLSDPGTVVPSGARGATATNPTSPNGVDFVMQQIGQTPSPTPSATPTATVTPTPTATITPTPTPSASPSPSASPVSHLANISTRLNVGTGDNVLIGGFIIQGSGPKKIIVRGIGPSLPVAGKLADPVLELHQGSATLAINDNWKDTQQQEIEASTIPPSNDLEAAIVQTLSPGAYTAILRGAGDATGIGLVEVYDLEQDSPAKIVNISTRGFVQSGDDVMIGGVIVTGNESSNVVIRAIGPSLPVANKLADPVLELHAAHGELIFTNDNWRDTQQAQLEASGLAPKNDSEAAILISLDPGRYTAIVRGVNSTTGVGLVEVYKLSP